MPRFLGLALAAIALAAPSMGVKAQSPSETSVQQAAPAGESAPAAPTVAQTSQPPVSAPASAQPAASDPPKSCLPPYRQMPAERINAILVNPKALLERFPGGGGLAAEVRALVSSAPQSLDAVMSLVSVANPMQKAAIGTGLASAALACVERHPDIAGAIQLRIATIGDAEVVAAFSAASGNVSTAATGVGVPGFAPSSGGPGPALGTGFAPGGYGGGFAGVETRSSSLFSLSFGSSSDNITVSRNLSGGSVSPSRP